MNYKYESFLQELQETKKNANLEEKCKFLIDLEKTNSKYDNQSIEDFLFCFDQSIYCIFSNRYAKDFFIDEYKIRIKENIAKNMKNKEKDKIADEIYSVFFLKTVDDQYINLDRNFTINYKSVASKVLEIFAKYSILENKLINDINNLIENSSNSDYETSHMRKFITIFNKYKNDDTCFLEIINQMSNSTINIQWGKFLSKYDAVFLQLKKMSNKISKILTNPFLQFGFLIIIGFILYGVIGFIMGDKEHISKTILSCILGAFIYLYFKYYCAENVIRRLCNLDDDVKVFIRCDKFILFAYMLMQFSSLILLEKYQILPTFCFVINHYAFIIYIIYTKKYKIFSDKIIEKDISFSELINIVSTRILFISAAAAFAILGLWDGINKASYSVFVITIVVTFIQMVTEFMHNVSLHWSQFRKIKFYIVNFINKTLKKCIKCFAILLFFLGVNCLLLCMCYNEGIFLILAITIILAFLIIEIAPGLFQSSKKYIIK